MPNLLYSLCCFIFFFCAFPCDGWQFWEKPLEMANPNKDGIYEFTLLIEHAFTMTLNPTSPNSSLLDYSFNQGTWTTRNLSFRTNCTQNTTLLEANEGKENVDNVLATLSQWDGKHRKIIMINGKSPGETIVVPLGAKVLLRVRNRLQSQAITMHVHGMEFRNRWWSDGVPYLQQCPIGPGADYVYRFIADTPGTLWYHAHLMGDRAMGLMGGFVVIRKNERNKIPIEEKGEDLVIGRQYYAILQDWNPENVEDTFLDQEQNRAKWMGFDIDSNECIQPENAGPPRTGPFFAYLRRDTILINQKGWHNQEELRQMPSKLPLSNFAIKKGENILLRIVSAGSMEELYVWIEGHEIWVVAADGIYVKPKKVDSVLILPGERYDLLVPGLMAPTRQPYHIIVETFDNFMANISTGETRKNYGLANLRYEDFGKRTKLTNGDSENVDWLHQERCSSKRPCQILNCPHASFYTDPRNYTCLNNDHLQNDANANANGLDGLKFYEHDPELMEQKHFDKNNFHEIFLNIHAGLNGWYNKMPMGIPHFHKGKLEEIAEFCDPEKCDRWQNNDCRCFHHYEFAIGDIIQLNLGTSANMAHPFHMHGTKFYVMKTGMMRDNYQLNGDLECAHKGKYCLEFKWANDSFLGGNVPNMNEKPVLRDTVMIPNKGYVTIRFRASNPGWFFAHCHLLFHQMSGMSFAYKVDGKNGEGHSVIPNPPANFPSNCGLYEGAEEEWQQQEEDEIKNGGGGREMATAISPLLFSIGLIYFFMSKLKMIIW